MPAFHSECRLSDGRWAVVRELARDELSELGPALSAWEPASGAETDAV